MLDIFPRRRGVSPLPFIKEEIAMTRTEAKRIVNEKYSVDVTPNLAFVINRAMMRTLSHNAQAAVKISSEPTLAMSVSLEIVEEISKQAFIALKKVAGQINEVITEALVERELGNGNLVEYYAKAMGLASQIDNAVWKELDNQVQQRMSKEALSEYLYIYGLNIPVDTAWATWCSAIEELKGKLNHHYSGYIGYAIDKFFRDLDGFKKEEGH
jgi:hypothetical protein